MRQLKRILALALCLAALVSAAAAFDDPLPGASVAPAAARAAELHNRGEAALLRAVAAEPAIRTRRPRHSVALRCAEGALFLCTLLPLLRRRITGPALPRWQVPRCCVGHPHHAPPARAAFPCAIRLNITGGNYGTLSE